MNPYTDQEHIENYLQRELTDREQDMLEGVIEAVSTKINAYTGRQWAPLTEDDTDEEIEAEERYFSGTGSRELFVDDFTQLLGVKLLDSDGSEYNSFSSAETDWITSPLNSNPKKSIRLRHYRFPEGYGNVLVEASALASALFSDMPSGEDKDFKKESIEGYSYELFETPDMTKQTEDILANLYHHKRIVL